MERVKMFIKDNGLVDHESCRPTRSITIYIPGELIEDLSSCNNLDIESLASKIIGDEVIHFLKFAGLQK